VCCSPAPRTSCRSCRRLARRCSSKAIAKLDKYQLLILDDLSYVHKDHAETSVLFELIGARSEWHSLLINANQPFADWNKVFPDHAMLIAAIDRLVHHSLIFEMT
jgi:DNA replication protein DnaC